MLEQSSKILIIGPVQPYRGGIAQHTTLLHRELSHNYECMTISFSRQYPRWLYPGKSDIDDAAHVEGVQYTLDSINPITWWRVWRQAVSYKPDIVIIPWWHVYWVFCFGWLARRLRKSGLNVVFICHNVIAHEDAGWKRFLTRYPLSKASRFMVHTHIDKKNLLAMFPDASVDVHPLPIFNQFPIPRKQLPRRAKLELLFFGFVRTYKGLDLLIEALALLEDKDIHISVVGEFWENEDAVRQLIEALSLKEKIEIVSGYVSDIEAAEYFSRCDAVILPYRSATGSAVIPLAYFYNKPVIATHVGGLPDVVSDGLSGLLVKPDSPSELAGAIKSLYEGEFVPNCDEIIRLKNSMSWSSYISALVNRD